MPRRRAVSTTARTASLPLRCPSMRGRPRRRAQRPFPSMMIATWRGRRFGSRSTSDISVVGKGSSFGTRCTRPFAVASSPSPGAESNRQDLLFFALQDFFETLEVVLRRRLDLLARAAVVVLGDVLLLEHLLQELESVVTVRAHRHAVILRDLVEMTDDLLPPLGGELGDRDAQDLSVAHRVQAEVRLLDGLLDRGERGLVEGLNDQQARLRRRQRRELDERRLRAVVLRLDPLEKRRRGATGARARELAPERRERLLHLLLEIVENFRVGHGRRHPGWTSFPIRSPQTAFLMLPGWRRLKTKIGRRLSMQSEIAVESMTLRPRFKISM